MTLIADDSGLIQITQQDTLARYMGEALFPNLLFRAGVPRELWEARAGQTMTFTNDGLYEVDTSEREPGKDPAFMTSEYEHYKATCHKHGKGITVDMPSNYATAVPLLYGQMKRLMLNGAQTLNRLIRNPLYTAYLAGHCIVDSAPSATTLLVSSLNGFREVPDATNAFPVPVSNNNPRTVLVNGAALGPQIIGTTPSNPAYPNGPGLLTFNGAHGVAAGSRIDALDASRIIRPNGAATVDGINAGDGLTMRLINQAVAELRRDNITGCDDGYFHVHFDPFGELDVQQDNAFQRQIQNRGLDDAPYLTFSVGRAAGCTFFSNNETPLEHTVASGSISQSRPAQAALARSSGEIGAELVNASGVKIARAIVMGAGAVFEKYVPEGAYMSEAGITGKVGGGRVTNQNVEIPMDGIRVVMKSPTDLFNERLQAGWSWSGDFVCPTNRLTGSGNHAYKRARVIEFAINV